MLRMRTLSFLVILIIGTAIDASAQSLQMRWERIIEQLERQLGPEHRYRIERLKSISESQRHEAVEMYLQFLEPVREKYRASMSGSEYCAADYGSAPPSRRPYRWCMYQDMASCLEATRDRSDYSCEPNQFGIETLSKGQRETLMETYLELLESMSDPVKGKYRANMSGSREYCAADYGSAPPSRRPHRWCMYQDMASCLEATRDRGDYSCELNQVR